MNGGAMLAAEWLLRTAIGGGILLLAAWVLMRRLAQPARRLRAGEWGVSAALLLTVLALSPAWFKIPIYVATGPSSTPATVPSTMPEANTADHRPVARTPMPESSGAASSMAPVEDSIASAPENEFLEQPSERETKARRTKRFVGAREPDEAARPSASDLPQLASSTTEKSSSYVGKLFAGLVYVYLVGAGILFIRWIFSHMVLGWLLFTAQPAPQTVRRLFAALHPNKIQPRLLVTNRLKAPISCGLLRPTIVLPATLCDKADEQTFSWIFAHELAHLEGRDVWTTLFLGLGQMVYFYLPWFWSLRRQVHLCQEFLADAAAVGDGDEADYAQFLLSLTNAPTVPVGAMGVLGRSSDLFQRVTMLLRTVRVETRPPRLWSLGMAGGLISLAAFLSVVGFRTDAGAAPSPNSAPPDAASEEPPGPEEKMLEEAQKRIEQARKWVDSEEARKRIAQAKRFVAKAQRQAEGAQDRAGELLNELQKRMGDGVDGFRGRMPPFRPGLLGQGHWRLGIMAAKPSPTLADQLDLPKGKGVVVERVVPNSPAAKAGVKPHDILLEFNGKSVPAEISELNKMIGEVKAETPIDIVVLRKGKQEIIKDVMLPEAKQGRPGSRPFGMPGQPGRPGAGGGPPGAGPDDDGDEGPGGLPGRRGPRGQGGGFGGPGRPGPGGPPGGPPGAGPDDDGDEGPGGPPGRRGPGGPGGRFGRPGRPGPGGPPGAGPDDDGDEGPGGPPPGGPGRRPGDDGEGPFGARGRNGMPPRNPGAPGRPGQGRMLPPSAPPGGAMTAIMRNRDRITARYQEGSTLIIVDAAVSNGEANAQIICVHTGGVAKKYDSVDQAPERYRGKIKRLIRMIELSDGEVEIRTRGRDR